VVDIVDMGNQGGCRKVVYLVYPVYLGPGDATGDARVTQQVTLGQREFPIFSPLCKG